ncbi:hypothetical protein BT96DRAFT_944422 [Gymnopus androsaceus JB14]|uniref:Uncharacterized protein n=1 Tax=Gymnopus androsaceus JB14 TaxID=1447944 RepID=A0A6A4H3N8_9AGAR|nr:hypothetical protein BT96DRAFT_944422 [Gymnopus androsaceus JB14]
MIRDENVKILPDCPTSKLTTMSEYGSENNQTSSMDVDQDPGNSPSSGALQDRGPNNPTLGNPHLQPTPGNLRPQPILGNPHPHTQATVGNQANHRQVPINVDQHQGGGRLNQRFLRIPRQITQGIFWTGILTWPVVIGIVMNVVVTSQPRLSLLVAATIFMLAYMDIFHVRMGEMEGGMEIQFPNMFIQLTMFLGVLSVGNIVSIILLGRL